VGYVECKDSIGFIDAARYMYIDYQSMPQHRHRALEDTLLDMGLD